MRSTITKARQKVRWEAFEDVYYKAVTFADKLCPAHESFRWHGMSVFACDGSKYTLPATKQLRKEFDPDSGLEHSGKGHYPQCLVMTIHDVFRAYPLARCVWPVHSSERQQVQSLLAYIPQNNLLLFDRGFPSYEFINHLQQHYLGYFIFRCPAQGTFPAVEHFVKSGKKQAFIWLDPSNKYLQKTPLLDRQSLQPLRLRAVRLVSPDGTVSVLLTNLLDGKKFTAHQIIKLYFKRWAIEGAYRDEKDSLNIETFHSKNPNGIRQELFAVATMMVIARIALLLSSEQIGSENVLPQFKNTIICLAADACLLVPDNPGKALGVFNQLLHSIARVLYYKPKKPRTPYPRVCKKPINKWALSKITKSPFP